jgi:hypothetical protein
MYELARLRNAERNRPPPKDIGECDWRGMSDADINAVADNVCPKHRELVDASTPSRA